ncbi:MAG: hypothetical protein QM699_03970 [Amaricoccus sp.]|uniref:hypothetical protein n=1 Tax=Amaricoccus sp. TaxID=1872485 RepID=UPI0039E352D4
MPALTPSPDLGQLRRQAKELLRAARAGDPAALARLEAPDAPRLHHAQRALAREAGFRSWPELVQYVEARQSAAAERRARWFGWAIGNDRTGHRLAARALADEPDLAAGDPWLACVAGDAATVAAHLARDPDFPAARGRDEMTPLAAVARSRLIHEPAHTPGLRRIANLLLAAGADPNARWRDPDWPDEPLPILHAAAGLTHAPGMTALLLAHGADPNDGESLYHSTEAETADCTAALLAAGARVAGTNALAHCLDRDNLAGLQLLLSRGADAVEPGLLGHALDRGRSLAHLRLLLAAGADPRALPGGGAALAERARALGRTDVLALLAELGIVPPPADDMTGFVAACARADEAAAGAIRARVPDILARLTDEQLRLLPDLAALGNPAPVRAMIAQGWPLETPTPEWGATALNTALFKGDAAMVALLLDAGADWRRLHGFGGNALGTLAFASTAGIIGDPAARDWAGCAAALLAHGVPPGAFAGLRYPPEVEALLATD